MEPDMIDMMSADDLRNELRSAVLQMCAANIKLANLEGKLRKAMTEKAVPVVGESERMLRAGFSRASFHDAAWAAYARKKREDGLLPQMSIHAIRNVFDSIFDSLPPTDSLSRARLDELLAAERRMAGLDRYMTQILAALDNGLNVSLLADVSSALSASKADGKGCES